MYVQTEMTFTKAICEEWNQVYKRRGCLSARFGIKKFHTLISWKFYLPGYSFYYEHPLYSLFLSGGPGDLRQAKGFAV